MTLVSWNVNSLNIRLPRLVDWLAANAPDVGLPAGDQVEDARFPVGALADVGYAARFTGQKSYNGVALLVRNGLEARDVTHGIDGFVDQQKRVIAATVDGVRVVCVYVPNGQSRRLGQVSLQARLVSRDGRAPARDTRPLSGARDRRRFQRRAR